jgi:hypothetical protein
MRHLHTICCISSTARDLPEHRKEVNEGRLEAASALLSPASGQLIQRNIPGCPLELRFILAQVRDKHGRVSVSDNGVFVFDPSANRQRRRYRWKAIRRINKRAGNARLKD